MEAAISNIDIAQAILERSLKWQIASVKSKLDKGKEEFAKKPIRSPLLP
jgi:hypothetical protein